jgi:hypothetical protein
MAVAQLTILFLHTLLSCFIVGTSLGLLPDSHLLPILSNFSQNLLDYPQLREIIGYDWISQLNFFSHLTFNLVMARIYDHACVSVLNCDCNELNYLDNINEVVHNILFSRIATRRNNTLRQGSSTAKTKTMSDQRSDTTSKKPKPLSTTQTTTAFSTPLSWSDSHKAHSQHQQSHPGLQRHAEVVASLLTSRPAFSTISAFSVPTGFNDSQRAHLHEQKIHQTAEGKAQSQATTTSFSSPLGYNDSEQAHMHQQKIHESELGKSASPMMIELLRTNPKFELELFEARSEEAEERFEKKMEEFENAREARRVRALEENEAMQENHRQLRELWAKMEEQDQFQRRMIRVLSVVVLAGLGVIYILWRILRLNL